MSTGRTVLITGGGSGLGAGLAGVFHTRGARVEIAGRTASRLEAAATRYPGMGAEVVDVADPDAVAALATRVARDRPDLDTVINSAGI